MMYGEILLVGLFSGYFLTEFVVNYPGAGIFYLAGEDMLALAYLTFILRAAFHIISGIGITMSKSWLRAWLMFGWPIMLIVNFGFIYSFYREWSDSRIVLSFSEIISLPKLFFYISFVGFDLIFVNKLIKSVNNAPYSGEEIGLGINLKKVWSLFFVTGLLFSILIFLGRPIKEGFHQGFYKRNLKYNTGEQSKKNLVLEKTKEKAESSEASKKKIQENVIKDEYINLPSAELKSANVKETNEEGDIRKEILTKQRKLIDSQMPYQLIIGFLSGICIISALIFQILALKDQDNIFNKLFASNAFFLIGFLLLFVYGVSLKLAPLYLTSLISFCLCLFILLSKSYEK